MIAAVESVEDLQPADRRFRVTPAIELSVIAAAVVIAIFSYAALSHAGPTERLIEPPVIALVLVANLLSGVALLMLFGRRLARRRAAASALGGRGRLHVKLVAIFSIVAAVPMLLVTIFASLLFQYGVQFWYSDQARGMIENASGLARTSYNQMLSRWQQATDTSANDIAAFLQKKGLESSQFPAFFFQQVYYRSMSDGILFRVSDNDQYQTLATINPDLIEIEREIDSTQLDHIRQTSRSVVFVRDKRIESIAAIPGMPDVFLFTATVVDMRTVAQQRARGEAVQKTYRDLLTRARSLQLRFNAALLLISLLIVGVALWIALAVADRLVRPVAELVGAARRVERGDLTARVPETDTRDEIGTLSNAFNRMTERLESQNTALVTANTQLDSRRALIEAVMSGVSAGVVSIAEDRTIRLINSSAEALLGTGGGSSVGRPLAEVAPELDAMLDQPAREAVVQMTVAGEARTLAVRIARDGTGPILTFDDITQQLLDQRRAAWSDVARRIAHEIKNPLTPIQLAAERLQRRYGKTIDPADTTFARLTDTIVRQVGDLRRMVDEFSSFARMPKPVFRSESLVDIARQTMFLHEVAHTGIAFSLVHDDPGPVLVCDRRQMGQALTNIVKNAVEAIEATGEAGGAVTMTLTEAPGTITIEVADSGVGLPVERDRIVEPYMTTRARGTGLGLAIVKKIVEEHAGTITFADRAEGGTLVCMVFDTRALAAIDTDGDASADDLSSDGGQLAALTRNRN